MSTKIKLISENWESFLRILADKISEATSDHPTSRCWTRAALAKVVQDIRREHLPSSFPHTPSILTHLINIGWAYPVAIDFPTGKTSPSKEFYLLDVTAAHGIKVDHLELMQAYKPDGIICYFSALTYHSLTTQFASHHHIASLIEPSAKIIIPKESGYKPEAAASNVPGKHSSLGHLIFTYQSKPCYLTKRLSSRLAGHQTRVYNSRTNLNITTLEQTLLDTLHKPIYCGGLPVVLEAWEEGLAVLDEEVLIEHLQIIKYPLLMRRVGAIFDLFGYSPVKELSITIEKGLKSVVSENYNESISLLPGFNFSTINKKWHVHVP